MIGSCADIELATIGSRIQASNAPPAVVHWLRNDWEISESGPIHGTVMMTFAPDLPPAADADDLTPQTTTLPGFTCLWQRQGTRSWRTSSAEHRVELSLHDGGATIRACHVEHDATAATALHVALCEALRAHGLVPLHAAVAERNGQAIAFLACSGTGKSTALLSAIDAGCRPIAEDFAWLDLDTGRVFGWPGERGVRLHGDGLARVPRRWQVEPWRVASDGKYLLNYDYVGGRVASAQLTTMVLLERDASRTTAYQSLSTVDAVRALWESAGVPLCTQTRDAFAQQVPSLLHRLEWRRLIIGRGDVTL